MNNDIIEKITPDEALIILQHLSKSDGILKKKIIDIAEGLFKNVDKESKSEFKDWATDLPGETFIDILKEWSGGYSKSDKAGMTTFIHKEFPDWSSWVINQI